MSCVAIPSRFQEISQPVNPSTGRRTKPLEHDIILSTTLIQTKRTLCIMCVQFSSSLRVTRVTFQVSTQNLQQYMYVFPFSVEIFYLLPILHPSNFYILPKGMSPLRALYSKNCWRKHLHQTRENWDWVVAEVQGHSNNIFQLSTNLNKHVIFLISSASHQIIISSHMSSEMQF